MDNFDLKKYLAESKLKNSPLNENSREVKVTEDQKRQMLKVANDLLAIVKTHHDVDGTRLLSGKMQDRDALIDAARILQRLARFQ